MYQSYSMVALSFGTLISTAAAICHEPPSVKGTASSYGPMQFGRLLAKESSIDLESVMPSSTAKPAQPEVRDEPKLKQRSRKDSKDNAVDPCKWDDKLPGCDDNKKDPKNRIRGIQ